MFSSIVSAILKLDGRIGCSKQESTVFGEKGYSVFRRNILVGLARGAMFIAYHEACGGCSKGGRLNGDQESAAIVQLSSGR